jgi:hypothetical protein
VLWANRRHLSAGFDAAFGSGPKDTEGRPLALRTLLIVFGAAAIVSLLALAPGQPTYKSYI